MQKCLFALAVPVLCLFVSANAFGQDREKDTTGKRAIHPASRILGMDIRNTKNESLGHVEDCVINMKDGKVIYVAMGRGQVLGFGGSLFAIAPDALRMGNNNEYLILEGTNADFENAKGFDQNAWPTQPDRRFGKGTANGANTTGTRNDTPPADAQGGSVKGNENMARVSAITGLPVYGRDANDRNKDANVGRIYDLAMDCSKHQVAYVAVHHGGTLGVGGKLVAVPWNAVTLKAPALDPQRRAFYVNATAQDFERAEGFTSDSWPQEPTAAFRDLRREGNQ